MSKQLSTRKKVMLQALEKTLGVVSKASKIAGIERTTHYLWLNTDEDYKEEVKRLNDIALDYAESQLHKQIGEGNTTATIFYLKCKGRERGYIERMEHDHTSKGDKITNFKVEIVNAKKDEE